MRSRRSRADSDPDLVDERVVERLVEAVSEFGGEVAHLCCPRRRVRLDDEHSSVKTDRADVTRDIRTYRFVPDGVHAGTTQVRTPPTRGDHLRDDPADALRHRIAATLRSAIGTQAITSEVISVSHLVV